VERHDHRVESDWDDSVSMRLACLALDKGRLTDDLVTALAVRGALLVDLTLRGRVTETADAVEVDFEPSGFAPADRLLAGGAPSLIQMLTAGPVDQYDMAAEHLRRGSWSLERRFLGRRYIDHRADRTGEDEQALKSRPGRGWTPTDAALTAIAGVLGLLPTGRTLPTDSLLEATGPARGIVEMVVDEVNRRVVHGRAVRWADA
jgi:hypothetical protein